MLALALCRDDDRAVLAALRHPDDVRHAAQKQPVRRLHPLALQERVAPIHAVVRELVINIALGVTDDLVHHDIFSVPHAGHDGHAGAQLAVGHGDGVLHLAPRFAAVLRNAQPERLVKARVGVRALVGQRDGQLAVRIEVDARLPYGTERVEILFDGRPALDDGRAELPRLAVVAAYVEGDLRRSKVERHGISRKHDGARGQVAALLRQLVHDGLETDAVAVLRVLDLPVLLPRHAAVAARHDGHDGRLFHRRMVEGGEQQPVQLARVVQLHDARVQRARRVLVHLLVARGEHHAHVFANDLKRHIISPLSDLLHRPQAARHLLHIVYHASRPISRAMQKKSAPKCKELHMRNFCESIDSPSPL